MTETRRHGALDDPPISNEVFAALGRMENGFYGFRCWVTALELGLVQALGERPDTAAGIASRTSTDARAVGRLLDALVAIGLVTKQSGNDPRYALEAGLESFAEQAVTYTRHMQR